MTPLRAYECDRNKIKKRKKEEEEKWREKKVEERFHVIDASAATLKPAGKHRFNHPRHENRRINTVVIELKKF